MRERRITALLAVVLVGCGASSGPGNRSQGGETVNGTLSELQLTSDAFGDGQPIPPEYTCDGGDRRPIVQWDVPPTGTRSFALIIDDPDAPGGTFRHWGVYDIPGSARSIGGKATIGTEVTNDFGKLGYGGPCPPRGHGPHHYHLKLFALDVDRLEIDADAKVDDVEREASRHALAKGELIGTYARR